MAATTTEGSFDGGLEAVELVIRDERQCRSCEAAAVDADGSLTRQQLLAEGNGEGHVLLFDVAGGGHILQQRPRRHTGLIDVVQKRVKIVVPQCPHLHLHTAVFVEKVDGAQHRAVAGFLADFRNLCVKLLLIDLTEDFFSEERCDFFISIGIAAYSSVKSA